MDSFMFSVFPIFFFLIFFIILGMIVFAMISGLRTWNKNNNSPKLTVDAKVVSKRQKTSSSSHGTDHHHHSSSTYYYVTFQVESGDRMEFQVRGQEFGLLVEGDVGELDFQGTRYLGFNRKLEEYSL